MTRRVRALIGSTLLGASLLASAGAACAQDLAPPSTGTPSDPSAAPGPPAPGYEQPQGERLDTAEKKDSGRGLEWLYLNAHAGFAYTSLDSLSSSNFAVQNSSAAGPSFALGAGIRLFILTLGVRATLNELSSFSLWQMDAELGIHIPIGHWDPYFGLHGGYCFVGSLDDGVSMSPNLSITGGDAGIQLGLDYYFNHFVSLGLEVAGSALFLERAATTSPNVPAQDAVAYQQTGDSVGFGIVPSLHLGFHL